MTRYHPQSGSEMPVFEVKYMRCVLRIPGHVDHDS